ncbi:MAG: hypothetical protein ABW007_26425 [Chitinophagaceae bacterium]
MCKTGENCEEVYRNWERNYFHDVWKKKKAVCDGNTRVHKRMCEIATRFKRAKAYHVHRTGNMYRFDYILPDNSLYYIELLFDYRRAMRVKVKTGKS